MILLIIRIFAFFLEFFSLENRRLILAAILRTVLFLKPEYYRVSLLNLERAFPDKEPEWRKGIVRQSIHSLSRLLVDVLRMDRISADESNQLVNFPEEERFLNALKADRPVILASGHLGNFELCALSIANKGVKLGVVARDFKPENLNRWWTRQRESCGNKVISRNGALKSALKMLKSGMPVGILFDQNITRQFAEFVDWFGYPAATSKLIGLLAVRNQASIVVISMKYEIDGKYTAVYKIKDFDKLYADNSINQDQKVRLITEEISADYVEMIRANPTEWFWMHKRWKTAPEGKPEDFYSTC